MEAQATARAPSAPRLAHPHGHAAVLEAAGGVLALVLQVERVQPGIGADPARPASGLRAHRIEIRVPFELADNLARRRTAAVARGSARRRSPPSRGGRRGGRRTWRAWRRAGQGRPPHTPARGSRRTRSGSGSRRGDTGAQAMQACAAFVVSFSIIRSTSIEMFQSSPEHVAPGGIVLPASTVALFDIVPRVPATVRPSAGWGQEPFV